MKNRPYYLQELNNIALHEIYQSRKRVFRHRRRHSSDAAYLSTKIDSWDPPRVVVACGSMKPPYKAECGRQKRALINGHPKLKDAYISKGLCIGYPVPKKIKIKKDQPYWEPGHCAEPHAAHKLLNSMDKINPIDISDILFGYAFRVMNGMPIPYCNTCKLVFPQLR